MAKCKNQKKPRRTLDRFSKRLLEHRSPESVLFEAEQFSDEFKVLSTSTSTLDVPFVSDSGGCSRNLEEQERTFNEKCTCLRSQENLKSSRFHTSMQPIVKAVLFCVRLIMKIGNVFKKSYKDFTKVALVCSLKKQNELENLSQIITMLHSDNKQMANTFLEKVDDLSEKLTQMLASNETLAQELKKIQHMLQDTRTRSPKPPPPLSLPPMPSVLNVPPPPPPPPPLPVFQYPTARTSGRRRGNAQRTVEY